jgi:hypothetical protein
MGLLVLALILGCALVGLRDLVDLARRTRAGTTTRAERVSTYLVLMGCAVFLAFLTVRRTGAAAWLERVLLAVALGFIVAGFGVAAASGWRLGGRGH